MTRQSVWFEGGKKVSVREEPLEGPGAGEVLVQTVVCAISPGTEMLFYRGELPSGTTVDGALHEYDRQLRYPLRYGYASVGRVVQAGADVDQALIGRTVFAFVPHASAFTVPADSVIPVPAGIEAEEAAFLATAETAANLVLDSRPLLGERVSVFGLGVVGLLTAGILAGFPLGALSGWDLYKLRREKAALLGVSAGHPGEAPTGTEDLAVEVSSAAAGFRLAVRSCGFSARVVVGSWYGSGAAPGAGPGGFEAFDTSFHRNRVRIVSSQVSTIDPSLTGRWDRARRLGTAWDVVRRLRPARLITNRIPFARAADAYRLISDAPAETVQVMLVHGSA